MLFKEVKIKRTHSNEAFPSNFYSESLYFFNQEINTFISIDNELQTIISESILFDDMLMLNEGCKDYISNVLKYLKDTSKYVDTMWNKFNMEHNLAKKETARMIGQAINKVDSTIGYSFNGYRYTISDENIHIDRYLKQSESQIRQQLMHGIDELKEKADSDEYYDNLRGQFVNNRPISAEDFQKELHRKYRNGKYRQSTIIIDNTVKDEMIDALFEVDDNMSSCIHIKNGIDLYVKSLISYFSRLQSMSENVSEKVRRDHEMDTYDDKNLDELAQIQTTISRKIIHIYILVLSAKMDAINERQRSYSKVFKSMIKDAESRGDDEDDE